MTDAPRGRDPKDGACNEPMDIGMFRVYYCHRDDNGSGMCNIHQAAKKRGAKQRARNLERRRQEGWARRRLGQP